jgi:hypothetical protein
MDIMIVRARVVLGLRQRVGTYTPPHVSAASTDENCPFVANNVCVTWEKEVGNHLAVAGYAGFRCSEAVL